jgi:hypothetical protein
MWRDLLRVPALLLPAMMLWGIIGWMTTHVV